MPNNFHQSAAWRKLAKEHKLNRCDDCNTTNDIQSGHILAAARFPMSRLWKSNLKYQCQPCNLKQGIKLQLNLKTIKLLVIYGMIKFITNTLIILFFAFALTVIYKDLSSGGMEASFSGQIITDVWGVIKSITLSANQTTESI